MQKPSKGDAGISPNSRVMNQMVFVVVHNHKFPFPCCHQPKKGNGACFQEEKKKIYFSKYF